MEISQVEDILRQIEEQMEYATEEEKAKLQKEKLKWQAELKKLKTRLEKLEAKLARRVRIRRPPKKPVAPKVVIKAEYTPRGKIVEKRVVGKPPVKKEVVPWYKIREKPIEKPPIVRRKTRIAELLERRNALIRELIRKYYVPRSLAMDLRKLPPEDLYDIFTKFKTEEIAQIITREGVRGLLKRLRKPIPLKLKEVIAPYNYSQDFKKLGEYIAKQIVPENYRIYNYLRLYEVSGWAYYHEDPEIAKKWAKDFETLYYEYLYNPSEALSKLRIYLQAHPPLRKLYYRLYNLIRANLKDEFRHLTQGTTLYTMTILLKRIAEEVEKTRKMPQVKIEVKEDPEYVYVTISNLPHRRVMAIVDPRTQSFTLVSLITGKKLQALLPASTYKNPTLNYIDEKGRWILVYRKLPYQPPPPPPPR